MANEKDAGQTSGADKTANAAETTRPGNPEKNSAAKPADSTAPANEAPADRSAAKPADNTVPADRSADTPENSARRKSRRRSGRSRSSETDRANASDRTADRSKVDRTSDRSEADRTADQTADRPKVDRTADRTNTGRRSEAPARDENSKRQTANSSGRSNASNASNRRENSNRSASTGAAGTPRMGGYSIRPSEPAKATKPASRWTLRDYILQLSVVIIGIVVTFVGSDMISRWSRQQQVKTVMQLVVSELEKNREQLREVSASLRYDQQGMVMLMEYDMDVEAIPDDSLTQYRYIISRLHTYRPQQDALEVLKSSDMISAVGDKQLLVDILGCYNQLDGFRDQVLLYSDRKREAQSHLFANNQGFSLGGDKRYSWRGILADPLCSAFLGTSAYFFGFDNNFDERIAAVDNTIDLIKTKYGFK